jgi:predicted Zn-dependent protease
MAMSGWSVAVLAAASALWLASGVERERPVLSPEASDAIAHLEANVAAHPESAPALRDLSQAYLEVRAPGLAISLIQHAPASVRSDPWVDHAYARALLDQGRAEEALTVERRVLDRCASDPAVGATPCDTWLIASATRRTDILQQLVHLGVEDAQAHPEASLIAYQNATREARLAVVE